MVAAYDRRPIRERSSLFLPDHFGVGESACFIHWLIVVLKQGSFSWSKRISPAMESVSTPKMVRVLPGPSVLSAAIGNPNSSQREIVDASA